MNKLINLQVLEAKNVICGEVIPDKDKEKGVRFYQGLYKENCQRAFMVPSHIIIGVFEDGTVRAAGIQDLNILSIYGQYKDNMEEGLFYFDDFVYNIDIKKAEAIVRYYLYDESFGDTEEEIKSNIYNKLLKSGVTITEEARMYFTSE